MNIWPRATAVVVLIVLSLWFGTLARRPVKGGPRSIVCLELAPNVTAANEFFSAWKDTPNWQQKLTEAQYWDTWFICAYAPLLTLLCWLAADHILGQGLPGTASVGYVVAGVQLLAGALDFLENAAMKRMIDPGTAVAPWPWISASASGIKWFLILAAAVYTLAAAGQWVWTWIRR